VLLISGTGGGKGLVFPKARLSHRLPALLDCATFVDQASWLPESQQLRSASQLRRVAGKQMRPWKPLLDEKLWKRQAFGDN